MLVIIIFRATSISEKFQVQIKNVIELNNSNLYIISEIARMGPIDDDLSGLPVALAAEKMPLPTREHVFQQHLGVVAVVARQQLTLVSRLAMTYLMSSLFVGDVL